MMRHNAAKVNCSHLLIIRTGYNINNPSSTVGGSISGFFDT